MTRGMVALGLAALATLAQGGPARACGGELPIACDMSDGENAARWMLRRVAAAVEARALGQFARGEAGFRTQDTYVFCIGPDGVMTAHPSAVLRGRDVRGLRDEAGNRFVATMLGTAKPDQISRIRASFPAAGPGSTRRQAATAGTAFYTRAGGQVCGVGAYDADGTAAGSASDAPVADSSRNPAAPAS